MKRTDASPSSFVCGGCGFEATPHAPFACEHRGEGDIDHVLRRELGQPVELPLTGDANPYLRYRRFFHAHGLVGDAAYVAIVDDLDRRISAVDGRGFVQTSLLPAPDLARAIGLRGELWIKNETGNVSGSHKARHLMGVMIHLLALERLGLQKERAPLAISSCGNAALAAAVVAKAAQWPISVFIPPTADSRVKARLESLGATIVVCERTPGSAGDPCTQAFRAAVRDGFVPFSCQGPDNALAIEGGLTLGYEIAGAMRRDGIRFDRLFVQVGGGALGSACFQGLSEASVEVPRLFAVQTEGAHPLERAMSLMDVRGVDVRYASAHKSEFMWPWESEPKSLAHGILDDETYDWQALVRAMHATRGQAVVVSEQEIVDAHRLARLHTEIPVDPTGSAGLAGVLSLARRGEIQDESLLVLFTGRDRAERGAILVG